MMIGMSLVIVFKITPQRYYQKMNGGNLLRVFFADKHKKSGRKAFIPATGFVWIQCLALNAYLMCRSTFV